MDDKRNSSRTSFAIKNLFMNFSYQIVNTVVNIIVPPLLISRFGSAVNGLISTIKQIMSYIQLVGAGISESTVVSLYKPLGEKNNRAISAIYNAINRAFNKAGILFSIISLLAAFIYPLFLNEELSYGFIVKIVLVSAIAGASEFFALGKYRSLLIADQKLYIVNASQIFGSVLSAILTIFLIYNGNNVIIVQLAASLAYVLRIIILFFYVRKRYAFIDKKETPDMTATYKRGAATVHQVAGLVIFGSQTIFVANFCGLAEASVYSVYNLVFTGLNTILSTVSSAMLAGMGNLLTTDREEKVTQVYEIYELGYLILTFTIYITALIMIIPFIKLYTFGVTDAQYVRMEIILLFSVMGLLNCIRTPGATMINAKGYYNETKNRALIEMVICLVGQAVLVGKFGIAGVLIGTIIAYLYRTLDVIIYSNKIILKRQVRKTLFRNIRYVVLLAAVGCLIMFINITATNYFQWVLYALVVACMVFLIVLAISFVFDKKTLISGFGYIKQIFGRRR